MSEIFLADGWRVKAGWLMALLMPAAAGLNSWAFPGTFEFTEVMDVLRAGSMLILLAFGIYFAIGFARRAEPVVEVSDAAVRWSSIYLPSQRGELRMDDVRGASVQSGWLVLDTRAGDAVRVGVSLLRPETCKRVLDSVTSRIQLPASQ